jgi:DNA modification methylase
MIELINGTFQKVLPKLDGFKMIFADPPDNIGLGYETYKDRVSRAEYERLLRDILWESRDKCEILWISFNARHLPIMGLLFHDFLREGGWVFKPGVQTFTFGQNNKHDLGNGHRPLWRLMRENAVIYPDAVRVPSWRQLNGDPRAAEGGRVPLDVFDFPRVVGNSRQRRKWHKTQLHEGLYERCVKLSCCAGDKACDLFAGTGTLARVCEPLGVDSTLVEMDVNYCQRIAKEHDLHVSTDAWLNVRWESL